MTATLRFNGNFKDKGYTFFIPLLMLFLTIIYYPIFGTYAHTDSYEFFWNAKRNPIFHHVFIQGGRPLFGFFITALFQWADSIEDLKYIRMIAFTGNVFLLITFYVFLVKHNFSKRLAAGLTLFFASSAFICLVMSWTALFQAGWAMLFGLVSALFCLRATADETNRINTILCIAASIATGLISLMLYQPSFTLFIVVVFLSFEKRRGVSHLIKNAVVYLSIFAVYFVLFKAMLWYTGLPPLGRSGINFDILGKISWFISNPLAHALKFNLLSVRNTFANMFRVPVLLLFVFCIVQYFQTRKLSRESISYGAIVVGVYFLAYLPNLVSMEYHASNRSLASVVLLNAYFFYKMMEHLVKAEKIMNVVFVAAALLFGAFGFVNLRYGVTKIHSTEYAILKKATHDILKRDTNYSLDTIHIIRPANRFLRQQGIVQMDSGGEFGLLSNSVDWATLPMFLAFIDELAPLTGHNPADITLNICEAEDGQKCATREGPVLDIGHEFLKHYREYY